MFVPIIMGSPKDIDHAKKISAALNRLEINNELRVASAHKSARYLLEMLDEYESNQDPKVYITIAGRSNALSGMVDANVSAPVIACPPYSDKFNGADLYSSLRMPSGVAPAVVLEPQAAALFATKILSLAHPELHEKVKNIQKMSNRGIEIEDRLVRD
tara:strand:- start:4 stop:477 length:474 start_codon:yes stop_codon:yes gene_type:complete